mmetsp:Transcript_3741/g.4856  ORF Transcript_3741/g.4856 Transcript_3741/m.4856 type:complete len:141 (-) Transcript_3741:461-883(-)
MTLFACSKYKINPSVLVNSNHLLSIHFCVKSSCGNCGLHWIKFSSAAQTTLSFWHKQVMIVVIMYYIPTYIFQCAAINTQTSKERSPSFRIVGKPSEVSRTLRMFKGKMHHHGVFCIVATRLEALSNTENNIQQKIQVED